MSAKTEVIVIGAGAAGLSAAQQLVAHGVETICLEARDRIGGRICTVHDPKCPVPVELGAEFIHGRPPEIWDIVRSAPLTAYDCTEHSVHIENGAVVDRSDAWLPVDEVMEQMAKAAETGPDQSFAQFLQTTSFPENARQLALGYVQGFNAARADEISIQALTEESRAADAIDGDRAFRIQTGYDAVAHQLSSAPVHLETVVASAQWSRGEAVVQTNRGEFRARCVLTTVPLGVLQRNGIRFDPEPLDVLHAAGRLRFGHVMRVILRFSDRVWEQRPELADAGFLLSQSPSFPTWWTPLPMRAPIITGWSAGPKADALLALDDDAIKREAQQRLREVAGLSGDLERAYFHPWHTDPFTHGAYSYVPAGATDARKAMTIPVDETLFFAGEATEDTGHAATVHGAIRSGRRAAEQILQTLRG